METTLLHWLELFFLPPGINFSLLLVAVFLYRRYPLTSFFISLSSVLLLLLLSMPIVARQLLTNLQQYPALEMTELGKEETKGAIVILGGGRYSTAPEYGFRDEISPMTLARLRYGAEIAEKLELPILLSGGRRNSNATAEAVIMNQVMVDIFRIYPRFLEVDATNTHEQAINVSKLLAEQNINSIYLVTHAWHMKRAVAEFTRLGIEVKPASMGFAATSKVNRAYMPSASALASSSRALHEYYGLFYLGIK